MCVHVYLMHVCLLTSASMKDGSSQRPGMRGGHQMCLDAAAGDSSCLLSTISTSLYLYPCLSVSAFSLSVSLSSCLSTCTHVHVHVSITHILFLLSYVFLKKAFLPSSLFHAHLNSFLFQLNSLLLVSFLIYLSVYLSIYLPVQCVHLLTSSPILVLFI